MPSGQNIQIRNIWGKLGYIERWMKLLSVDRCGTAGSSLNLWCGRLRAGTRTMYIEPVGHMWNPSEMSRLSLPYQVDEVEVPHSDISTSLWMRLGRLTFNFKNISPPSSPSNWKDWRIYLWISYRYPFNLIQIYSIHHSI